MVSPMYAPAYVPSSCMLDYKTSRTHDMHMSFLLNEYAYVPLSRLRYNRLSHNHCMRIVSPLKEFAYVFWFLCLTKRHFAINIFKFILSCVPSTI